MYRSAFAVLFACLAISQATAEDTDAARIYATRCAFCHGTSGKGDGPAGVALKPPPKDLSDPQYWKSADPENLKTIVADGKPGTAMIAFKNTLTSEQIAALVEHLKTFTGAR